MSQCDFEDDWEDFTPSLQDQLFENLEHVELAAAQAHDSNYTDNNNSQQQQRPQQSAIITTHLLLEELTSSQKENIPLPPQTNNDYLSQHSSSSQKTKTSVTPTRSNIDKRILSKVDSLDDDAIWGSDFDIDMLSSIQDSTERDRSEESSNVLMNNDIQPKEETNEDPLFEQLSTQLSSQQNVGFVTASGKGIPMPSRRALDKAKLLFEKIPLEEETEEEDNNDVEKKDQGPLEEKKDEVVDLPFSLPLDKNKQQQDQSFSLGFVTANGREIKPPSKDALEKAKTLLHDHSLAAALPPPQQQHNLDGGDQEMMINNGDKVDGDEKTEAEEKVTDSDKGGEMMDEHKQQTTIGTKRPADTLLSTEHHTHDPKKKKKTNTDEEGGDKKRIMEDISSDSTVPSNSQMSITPQSSIKEQPSSSESSFESSSLKPKTPKPHQKDHHAQNKPLKDILKSTGSHNSRRIGRGVGGLRAQVKPFKSPIIPSKINLTKAAVENKRGTISKSDGNQPVFDLSTPEGGRYPLKDLGPPCTYTRTRLMSMMDTRIIDMTFESAKTYRHREWGVEQAKADIIQRGCTNVNTKWVQHHYAMIVWKLACLTRSYPEKLKDMLNPDEITRQLLYRYEREINKSHRSVIKRILEQDDVAAKHMVLAISEIISIPSTQPNSPKYGLRLTDGWYHILSTIDVRMSRAIEKKRLKVGFKLSICGAKRADQGEPQSPLDHDDQTFQLTISSNSSLPARWDTKLGYQRKKFIYRPIKTLFEDGGTVTMLDLIVCRKYPMMYMENLPNGQTVYRTAKEEEEVVYGKHIDTIMPNFKPEKETNTTPRRGEVVEERRVSGYFKIKVCDSKLSTTFAQILISNANEITYMDVKEGSRYRVSFLVPRPSKNNNQQLQLKTINTLTRWEPLAIPHTVTAYIPRSLTLAAGIREIAMNGYEIDMVACVLHSNSANQDTSFGRHRYHQTVYMTDQSLGLCQIHLRTQYLIKEEELNGQVIGLLNLKFERYDAKFDITCLKMTDESELIYKTPSTTTVMSKGLRELKTWVVSHKEEVKSVRERLNRIVQ